MPNNAQQSQLLESSFDKSPKLSSRALKKGVAIHKSTQVDSNKEHFAATNTMDCHAANAARNDGKTATEVSKVDSRDNAANLTKSQAAGFSKETSANAERYPLFCDDFGGFQGGGEGIYLSGNEQVPAAESPKSAQKPTPKTKEAESPQTLRIAFLSVLYSGKSPKAPGTAGSALSVLLGLPILLYSAQTLFLLACLLGIIAVREIDKWEAYSKKHDEKWIVIDELVGVWIAMAIIGAIFGYSISLMIVAFGTFRFFDIWKPSIIGRVDKKLKGGLGVVLDDVLAGLVAGVFSLIVLAILSRFGVDVSLWW